MTKPVHPSPQTVTLAMDSATVSGELARHLEFTAGKDPGHATPRDWFNAVAYTARDRITERWLDTVHSYRTQGAKRVYYLSLEFLIGRTLGNALSNLGMLEATRQALTQAGIPPRQVEEMESEAGLGNGGLGRLAACFMDSTATRGYPATGYGIRYEFGIFNQRIRDGEQVEHPDNWLRYDNPWEFPRPERLYRVQYGGSVTQTIDRSARLHHHWQGDNEVMAMAHDLPVPGFDRHNVNHLRLWAAKSSRDFDLGYFNQGDYIRAVRDKNASESISKVLYPSDSTREGRELRLKQQYFFVSASLQDILRRHLKDHDDLTGLPDKVAIQLNDTHPAIAIPELMRLLLDEHGMDWDPAWGLCLGCFAYTNHTLLPEALETWSLPLFATLLPRHLGIIYEINHRFLLWVARRHPGDNALLERVSLIDEDSERRIRMAHLACVGSHHINGVAALHSRLMRETIFADFFRLFPSRFTNITNGITPRRWLGQANRPLSRLIGQRLGSDAWLTQLETLVTLRTLATDAGFQDQVRRAKQTNKQVLTSYIRDQLGIVVDPNSLFDVQVKRIHEYKRQLLNLLHVMTLYQQLRDGADHPPRTVIMAGKAAPGYAMAKLIIALAHSVAEVVNHDPLVGDRLKLVFLPNYNVTLAEIIIPAADLSQQISTAGQEASGTGNMKLALNGALTIGTLDGANVEMRDELGPDNIFIFGLDAAQVIETLADGYDPRSYIDRAPALARVLERLSQGYFSRGDRGRYAPILQRLVDGGDPYLLCADYTDYLRCQSAVEAAWTEPSRWTEMAIHNIAGMGRFSSDRAIDEYARNIWGLHPVEVLPR